MPNLIFKIQFSTADMSFIQFFVEIGQCSANGIITVLLRVYGWPEKMEQIAVLSYFDQNFKLGSYLLHMQYKGQNRNVQSVLTLCHSQVEMSHFEFKTVVLSAEQLFYIYS